MLSGGERTRLAVARMLLRPSNTLLLDEPTNHLDLDSKEVLLDALVDYGGTLIFVSHDRYFVERLATKIIEVGNGKAVVYPGHLQRVPVAQGASRTQEPEPRRGSRRPGPRRSHGRRAAEATQAPPPGTRRRGRARQPRAAGEPAQTRDDKKTADAEARKTLARGTGAPRADRRRSRRGSPRRKRRSARSKQPMAAPGFYDDRAAAQPVIDRHQALMWEVGDLMHQWEELQARCRSRRRPTT